MFVTLTSATAGRQPAAKRLPQARSDDPQAALSLAVMRLRALPAWGAEADVAQLCQQRPPFGINDSPERVQGALWSVKDENRSTQRNGSTAPTVEEAAAGCARLGRAVNRITGRPHRSAFSTCAVVGSSGGLRGSRQGEAIDSHEAVFRFNSAPTAGQFSADVGNRTSLWVASHVPWRAQLRSRVGAFAEEEAALYCFNPWLGKCFSDALGGSLKDARGRTVAPLLVSPLLTQAVMAIQVALGGKSTGVVRPSTGLIGVGLALASCARVSLYGFANDSDVATKAFCNHYYDCRFNQSRYFSGKMGYHDWHGQWRVLEALVHLGALRYVPPTGPLDGSTAGVVPAPAQPRVPRSSRRDAKLAAKSNATATARVGRGGGAHGGALKGVNSKNATSRVPRRGAKLLSANGNNASGAGLRMGTRAAGKNNGAALGRLFG